MLDCYQRYTPKRSKIAELKTALWTIWNDLPEEFIDKTIVSFRITDFDLVLLQTVRFEV